MRVLRAEGQRALLGVMEILLFEVVAALVYTFVKTLCA